MNQRNLNSFLKFGYFLDYENKDINLDFSKVNKDIYKNLDESELIKMGSKFFLDSIANNFSINDKHLVPISGGLDSRAILAGLLTHTEAKNIHTYTFGTPKTLDYEIGNYIAKKLGTNHTIFDLTKHVYKQEELEDISKRVDFQTILFHHAPILKIDKQFKGFKLWSGFGGDALSGVKCQKKSSDNLKIAIKNFINTNTYLKSMNLLDPNIGYTQIFYDHQYLDKNIISYDEQIVFENIVKKFEAPHVTMKGFDYKIPILYDKWVDFILSIPDKYRVNQYLYKEILLNTFPKEFSYKIKGNMGLPLKTSNSRIFIKRVQNKLLRMSGFGINRGINYLDFNVKIREKNDLREIFKNNIMDLKSRNIIDWIDVEKILLDHLSKKGNYADALIVLASLEIHLKSGLEL